MTKTYQGGCHCGAVRFECDLEPDAETSRCNCSICAKGRFWKTIAKKEAFRLLQGAEVLSEYKFGNGIIQHCFCRQCGIKPFGRGNLEALGGVFYGVNMACLDGDAPQTFAAHEIVFQDGQNNDWSKPPAETRHL